ncbi:MAG: hydrogenase/urease maturation nickel metallochaperone HypA [Candidatus Omnitrophota bacterium]
MHEYHIVDNLVKQVVAEATKRGAAKVIKVNLAMGECLGFDAEAIRLYYQTISEGTIASGASVNVRLVIAGRDIYIENIEIETE